MPILNYTTKISAHKTVGLIQQILANAGATAVSIDYDETKIPVAITFLVDVQNTYINFRIPSNYHGVLKKLQDDNKVPTRLKKIEQARRVAWRITKSWIEAQMAIIEVNQAELAEVFLPYVVTPNGQTLYQEIKSGKFLLGSGTGGVVKNGRLA